MNPNIKELQPSPFDKLSRLITKQAACDIDEINLSFGEPQHSPYSLSVEAVNQHATKIGSYPTISGLRELRQSISSWLKRRFSLQELDSDNHVLPVNGTREAIFSFVQTVLDPRRTAYVAIPNPGYQIYEGATLLAGGTPLYIECSEDNNFRPDFSMISEDIWRNVQIVFLCSPGNPTGSVTPLHDLHHLLGLADEFDFIIASDECYSEIYHHENTPPPGLLQACASSGRHDYRRCLVFNSLSKRSNLPGLRSGFVAGDERLISQFKRYRTYHGCSMSLSFQHASIAAWNDEGHVMTNRNHYKEKLSVVNKILSTSIDTPSPEAGFFLWPRVPGGDDEAFTKKLYEEMRVCVLPGSYMGRQDATGVNPALGRVRIALVSDINTTIEGAIRIKNFLTNYCKGKPNKSSIYQNP